MLIIQVYVNYSSFADLPFVGLEMLDAPYIEGLSMSWCISPSPTGEARWGLMTFSRSNQFLPFFTLSMIFAKKLQPPLVLKPILTFPKGRDKLLCFVKDFSQSHQSITSAPSRSPP